MRKILELEKISSKLLVISGLIAVITALIVLGPFVTIWVLNTLFPVLAIPYTFKTWLAALIVVSIVKARTLVTGDGR